MAKPKSRYKITEPNKKLDISKDSLNGIEYPVFCFKHLQSNSIQNCKDFEFFYSFLDRLRRLSELGWKEIRNTQRHGFGMEKISVDQIKPKLPYFVTPEVNHLMVFRAHGDNRTFLGIQKNKLFHIIFIESNFGDIYNH